MPAIDSGKVLVTDANDFIAMWLVKALLERGFSVRGTVRSEAQGAHLKQTFASYGRRLEYIIVEDIAQVSATDGRDLRTSLTVRASTGWSVR